MPHSRHLLNVIMDVSAVPRQPVGAGRYVLNVAQALGARSAGQPSEAALLPDISLRVVSQRRDTERWNAAGTSPDAVVPTNRFHRLLWEQMRLPTYLVDQYSQEPFIWHSPHYTFPWKVSGKIPTIVTIHDTTFFDFPQFHERKKVTFFRRAIQRSVFTADRLIAVSEHTAERIDDLFPRHRPVTVIPHGIDHRHFNTTRTVADQAVIDRLGGNPFALFVGTLEPRKQVDLLIRAFDAVAERQRDLRLVLAGRDGWGMARIEEALYSAKHKDRILRLGYVAEEELPALYRAAAVTIYPSSVEGFGLPALEAMACGSPLIIAKGTPMDSFAPAAAIRVGATQATERATQSPESAEKIQDELIAAIEATVTDGPLRAEQLVAGPKTAAAYTWGRTADQHRALYAELADERGVRTHGP